MEQKDTKTETIEEFLARGGSIKKLPIKGYTRWKKRKVEEAEEEVVEVDEEPADLSCLPMALKIRYGIKD